MFQLFVLFFTALVNLANSGQIYPDSPRPIDPFRTNVPAVAQTVYADYKFQFRVQTPSSNYPIIKITFPSIYNNLVAGTQYNCQFVQSPTILNEICYVDTDAKTLIYPWGTIATTQFSQITGASATLTIYNMVNPSVAAGTGSGFFIIQTFSRQALLIDLNDFFGTIGLSSIYNYFSANTISNDGASIAGFVTNYVIDFTNTVTIPSGSAFRMQFPSGYTYTSNLACEFVNPSLILTCTSSGGYVFMYGLNTDLTAGTWRLKVRNVQNPFVQSNFNNFLLEALYQGTNTVIQQSTTFNTIQITAGSITNVLITGVPLNRNLRIDYDISFTTTNVIPAAGGIRIDFPSTFGSLDPTCRIIRGLSPSGSAISCTASSVTNQVSITGITDTNPQFIEIKIYATNPNAIGQTPQFQIHTYSSTPFSTTNLIDDNQNAGTVTISDVDNPIQATIDMYVPYTNISLGNWGPIDFRVYPTAALTQTTLPTITPQVWIQIPLWWFGRNQNGRYQCSFGPLDSGDTNGCYYYNNVFKMNTPLTKGLDLCDLPVSMSWVTITPIPGSWPFRVLLFSNTVASTSPFQQDLYWLDIPATQFTAASAWTTSLDSQDTDTVLQVTFSVGVAVPSQGAVNLNFSTTASIYDNTASWDPTLGFTFGGGPPAFTQISCTVSIGGTVMGYPGTAHPGVTCVAYVGDTTKSALIQVRGFSNWIYGGTQVVITIPNLKFCNEVTMNCMVMLTTAYTTVTNDPYSLNYYYLNLGTVKSLPSFVTGNVAAAPTFTQSMICLYSNWQFVFTPQTTLAAGNSYILLKFPANKFTFDRTPRSASVSSQGVVVIYALETDEIYYLIIVTSTMAGTPTTTFTLNNIRNSNGEINSAVGIADFSGIVVKQIYWNNGDKIEKLSYTVSPSWTDGGLWNAAIQFYPNSGAPFTRNLNLADWIPYTVAFTNCHTINQGGAIALFPPMTDYVAASPTCSIWSGVTGITTNNGYTSQLTCAWDAGSQSFRVQGFYSIPQFTTITIGFSLQSSTTALTAGMAGYNIRTYYDTLYVGSSMNDYLPTALTGLAVPGPKFAPFTMNFLNYSQPARVARVGTLGTFTFIVNLTQALPAWTSGNDAHLLFQLDPSMSIDPSSGLECRINGMISYQCYQVGTFTVKVRMNQFTGITAGLRTNIVITTLGAGNNANLVDGIVFGQSGRYTTTSTSYLNGAALESSQLEFNVYGADFLKYWVYSLNKGNGGRTLVKIIATLNAGDVIPSSAGIWPILQGLIVLEFPRTTTSGWASDLGTGIANKQPIPCISLGLNILTTQTDITCTLVYGLYNNPVKIMVTGFDITPQSTNPNFEIHIPNIFNPNSLPMDVPNIITRIYSINTVSGAQTEIFYHDYPLINVTYSQNPATSPVVVSAAPTLSATTLSVPALLTVQIVPSVLLRPSDSVVLELPLFWKPPKAVTCNFPGLTTNCIGYPDAKQILIEIQVGTIPVAGITGTIAIVTPPAVIPNTVSIVGYYYHCFKLWNTASYPALATVLNPYIMTVASVATSVTAFSSPSIYTFTFVPIEDIPAGGAIMITIPPEYTITTTTCTNNAIGGSLLSDTGFQCTVSAATNQLIAYGFPQFTKNNPIVLQALLTNPASLPISNFVYQTHYLNGSPPNTLICTATVPAPSLSAVVTPPTTYWATQISHRDFLYAGDIGPIEFKINLPTVLATTEVMIITLPAAFNIAPQGQPDCYWDGVYGLCTYNSATKKLTISPPTTPTAIPITASTVHLLKITSLNGMNERNGYQLPATPGTYTFTLQTSPDGGSTIREQQNIDVGVYPPKFTYFASTTEITNYNIKTSIRIEFQPSTAIPAGGRLLLYVPTQTAMGVTLWDDDLRSGVANGGTLPCHDVGASFGYEPTCTLTWGNKLLGIPALITVTGITGTLNTATLYSFRVNGIMTPAQSGDDKHVIMRLESYSTALPASYLNGGLFYDFTIQKVDPTPITVTTTPTTTPLNALQTGVTFSLQFYSSKYLYAAEMFDYYVLEFPSTLPQPLGLKCNSAGDTQCVSLPGNNWLFYNKSDADTPAAGTTAMVNILYATQAAGRMSSAVLYSYAISNRMAIAKYQYPPIDYSTLSLQSIATTITVPSYTAGYIPINAPIKYQVAFTIPNGAVPITVPATGAIEIVLPASVAGVDTWCSNAPTSAMAGNYACSFSSSIYTITSFNQLNPGTNVIINFWGQVSAAGTPSFQLRFYQDAAKTIKIAENTAITSPTISSYTGMSTIYPIDTTPLNQFGAKAGSIAPYTFSIAPGSTFTNMVTVTFPTGWVSVPTGATLVCGWGSFEAARCVVTATAPLTVQVYAPNSPALVSTTVYNVFISTYQSSATNIQGLQYNTAGKGYVTVTVGAATASLAFEIYPGDFNSIVIQPLWANANVNTHVAFTVSSTAAIPLGGKVVISFPRYTLDGVTTLFATDLGTGFSSGSTVTCNSVDKTILVPVAEEIVCTLIYGSDVFTYIEVSGFQALTANTAFQFFIQGIKNPAGADTGHVHLQIHTENAAGTILNKRLIVDAWSTQSPSVTTSTSTYSRNNDNVQTSGVTYQFTGLLNTQKMTAFSSIVIQFPDIFKSLSTVSATVTCGTVQSVTLQAYSNFLILTPTTSTNWGVNNIDISLTSVTNPYSKDTLSNAGVVVYLLYYSSYEVQITASVNTNINFTPANIALISNTQTSTVAGAYSELTFDLQLTSKIPTGGALKIVCPASVTVGYGYLSAATLGTSVTFSYASNTATFVFGTTYIPTMGDIFVTLQVTSPTAAAAYSFTPTVYIDSTTTTRIIATGAAIPWTTVNASPVLGTLSVLSTSFAKSATATTLTLYYVLNSATTASNVAEFKIDVGGLNPAGATCTVAGTSQTCTVSGSVVTITGLTGILANPSVNIITITSVDNPSSAGHQTITVTAQNTGGTTTYDKAYSTITIYNLGYSTFTVNPAHQTASTYNNNFAISVKTGATAVTSPIIFVEFISTVWSLGAYADGATVPCYSSSSSTLACTVQLRSGMASRIQITGMPNLAASTTYTFTLFKVRNPIISISGNVLVKISTISSGNLETDIYGDAVVLAFATGTVTTSSVAATLGSSVVQTATSYSLPVSPSYDEIYFELPLTDYTWAAAPTCTSCTLYNPAGVVGRAVTTSSSSTFTMSGMGNPISIPSSSSIVGYVVTSNVLTNVITYTTSAFTAGTIGSASFTPLSTNTGTGYWDNLVTFTLTKQIPSYGMIRISFPTASFAAAPTPADFRLTAGTNTGDITMKYAACSANTCIDLIGSSWTAGTVTFNLKLNQGKASGTVSGSVTTYGDLTGSSSIETAALSFTFTTYNALNAYALFPFVVGKTMTVMNTNGVFSFGIKQTSFTLLSTNRNIRLIPPASWSFPTTSIRCKFIDLVSGASYISKACYRIPSGTNILIAPPLALGLPLSEYQVLVYSTMSSNYGISFPAVNSDQVFQVNIEDLTNPTPIVFETNILKYKIMNSIATTGGRTSYINNVLEENLLKFYIKLQTAVASTGKIILEFPSMTPTVTFNNNNLFSSFTFNQQLTCTVYVNSAIDNTYTCLFTPGTNHNIKPAQVTVTSTAGRSAGDTISIGLSVLNGPTDQMWTNGRIYTQDSSLNYLDFYPLPYLVYHVLTTPIASTAVFPPTANFGNVIVQSLTTLTINVAPAVAYPLTQANSKLRFKYNSFFYGGSTQGVTTHTQELWSTACAFISFNSAPGTTPMTYQMTNMKNPMSNAAFTSTFETAIVDNGIITHKISYTTSPFPTWTLGSFTATSVSALGLSKNEMTKYTINVTPNKDIPAGGNLDIIFPTGYTMNTIGCYASTGGTCTVNAGTRTVSVLTTSAITASTAVSITAVASNPSSAGLTGAFTAQAYIGAYASAAIAVNSAITGVTIANTAAFNSLNVLDRKNDTIQLQDRMHGPMTFTYVPTNTLAAATGFVTFSFPSGYWVPPGQTISTGINLNCWWNDWAAPCFGVITSGAMTGYKVWAPYENAIASGTTYTVTISTTRYPYIGFRSPLVGPGTYVVTATDSASAVQNNNIFVPMTGFWWRYMGTRITTKTQQSIVYLGFSNHYPVNSSTIVMKTQIIVEFPVVDSLGNNIFPVDLGKGIANGQPVDCTVNIGTWNCKLNIGAPSVTTPATIIMESTSGIGANSNVLIYLPGITMPTNPLMRSQLRVYSRYFNQPTSSWIIQEDSLVDLIFYSTTSPGITTQTGLTAPVLASNLVGQPTSVNFGFNLGFSLVPGTYDRVVISTVTTGAYVPPTNPSSTQGNCYTYTNTLWVELDPTSTQAVNAAFQAQFTNWINNPYVLAGGIAWRVWVWKDGDLRQTATYSNTAVASPHPLTASSLATGNLKIRAVTTLTFQFTPFNYIPQGGYITITVPSTYMTIGPQCDVVGLTGASCVIQDDGDPTTNDAKSVTITGFNTYLPAMGSLQLTLGCQNPQVGGATTQFTWASYWPAGQLIDQNLAFGTLNIDASATYYEFILTSLLQKQTLTCGGKQGPMYIEFKLRNTLSYPNDFITIDFPAGFAQPPVWAELLCYFQYNNIYNLKTHRCDWVGQSIIMYAPEEKNFVAGDTIQLVITTRGANTKYLDGMTVPAVPGPYYVRVTTSNSLEEAYPIATIPPCPFNNFWGESAVWEAGKSTLWNFFQTTTTTIPSTANGGRLVVIVPDHNEIIQSFLPDLGQGAGWLLGRTGYIGCGGVCVGCPGGAILAPATGNNVECTIINGTGAGWGSQVIIMTNNMQQINQNVNFNFQISRIMNPTGVGWPYFTHARILVQNRQADGSYANLNDHWVWFIVPQYIAPNTPTTSSLGAWGFSSTLVNAYTDASTPFNLPSSAVMVPGTYSFFEFLPNDMQLTNAMYCQQYYNGTYRPRAECASMADSMWYTYRVTDPTPPPYTFYVTGNYHQLYYTAPAGITITQYRVVNRRIVQIINHTPYNNPSNNMEVVMQSPSRTNDVGTTFTYQVGVYTWTNIIQVKYFRLIMPSDFTAVTNCVIRRGLVLQNVNNPLNPIQCVISPYAGSKWLFEIYNFTFNTDGWFIFDVTVTNPPTPRFTGTWDIRSIDNYAGASTLFARIIDYRGNSDGRAWIGALPFPNLFRVYINTVSFENRRAKQGQWAEMDLRLITKKAVPPNSGQIQVWLPDTYNIPNGGSMICDVGNYYMQNLTGQACTITADRKIYMNTDNTYGIPAGQCVLVGATTTGSAGGNNGFQTSQTPGADTFQVFIYNGSTLQEYNQPMPSTLPNALTAGTYSIRVIDREISLQTVVRFKFTNPVAIPAGYQTDVNQLDPFLKLPIGTIQLKFNTKDSFGGWTGWPWQLGMASTVNVPCKVFAGLIPAAGFSAITCTMIAATQWNPNEPVIVELSNFEYIVDLTYIEVHIMGVTNGNNVYNNGGLFIGAYETFGDASTSQIILDSQFNQPLGYVNPIVPQVRTDLIFVPNVVGAVQVLNFNWFTSTTYNPNDVFVIQLPSPQFVIPNDGSVNAVIDGQPMTVWVYEDSRINQIHFEIPAGSSVISPILGVLKTLIVSGVRNMAYADNANYTITMTCIKSSVRNEIIQYTPMLPATVATPNSLVIQLSSYFSSDVFVTYTFTIVPSYDIPANGQFKIYMPSTLYDQWLNSNPAATCNIVSTDYLYNCVGTTTVGVSNIINFKALKFIPGATPLTITLNGVKNPTFVGTLAAGAFNTNIYHTNGKLINQGNFPSVTFVTQKSPDKIFMIIGASSYYKTVVADYSFTLQSSNDVPVGGTVILTFPINFLSVVSALTTITDLVGSWTTTKLLYTVNYVAGTGVLTITTQFAWPAKSAITIKIASLTNPSIPQTGVFVASTQYDGVTLDQTDPLDPSNTITYKDYSPAISVTTSSFYPTNAGENSVFSMTMNSVQTIPGGSQLEFDFPAAYGDILTTTDKKIICSSATFTTTCIVSGGKLLVNIPNDIPPGTPFDLQISGLANPNVGSGGGISITTIKDGNAIQFTNNALNFVSSPPATAMALTLLTTTSTNLEEKADYDICGQTPNVIPANAQFYVDFPQQFNIRLSSYQCSLGANSANTLTYPSGASCSVIQNLRRFIFTGQTNSYAGGSVQMTYCFKIKSVQNPSDSGESNPFRFAVYDPATQRVLYESFGILSYPTTITYQRVGLRIIIANIPDFSVGVISETISASLEQKVPYEIQLTPSCPGFDFLPQIIDFEPGTAIAYFNIIPRSSTLPGAYNIQWAKNEMNNGEAAKFAQVSDSYFNYLATAPFNAYQLLLSTTVSRTALGGTSLPITITLTQAPSQPMTLNFATIKPSQSEFVQFQPQTITFLPGETVKNLTYTTIVGAVSGIIRFSLPTPFNNLYYMAQTDVNFEILDIDNTLPSVINEYIVELDRSYMYYRISTSESVWVNYLLTLKGTVTPPADEILTSSLRVSRMTKTDVVEYMGKNASEQTTITSTYIYYDTYLKFMDLEEQTDYVLFYVVRDLSGNFLNTRKVSFTTLNKHHPCKFNILLQDNTPTNSIVAAFALVTGISQSLWQVVSAPPKYSIKGNTDTVVADILNKDTVTYDFMLLQNKTANEKRPIETVALLETNKYLLSTQLPNLVVTYDINLYSYEVLQFEPEFSYSPILVNISDDTAFVNISMKRNGTLFGVILAQGEPAPSARQIKYGLNSTNFLVDAKQYVSVVQTYPAKIPKGVTFSQIVKVTDLLDDTDYIGYFVAENTLPVNPDLMTDSEIQIVKFSTPRQIFALPDDYESALNLKTISLIWLLAVLLFILV